MTGTDAGVSSDLITKCPSYGGGLHHFCHDGTETIINLGKVNSCIAAHRQRELVSLVNKNKIG